VIAMRFILLAVVIALAVLAEYSKPPTTFVPAMLTDFVKLVSGR